MSKAPKQMNGTEMVIATALHTSGIYRDEEVNTVSATL